jgi:hypothetical protein
MPRPAKLRQTLRAASVPLLLSLAAHGLLLLALWFWPTPSRSTACVIESTRIALDTCMLDPGPPTLQEERALPAEFRDLDVGTTMAPRLGVAPPTPKRSLPVPDPVPVPDGRTGNGNGIGNGNVCHDGGGSFFPMPAMAARVVFVLDRSVSMGEGDKLDLACREMLVSLRRLPPAAQFQVILYNDSAMPLVIDGRNDFLPAESAVLDRVADRLKDLPASGGTDHVNALRRGLALHPDVLFFVTDADQLPYEQIESITRGNPGAAIHIVELTRRGGSSAPLARLARDNRGTYRRVPLGAEPRP